MSGNRANEVISMENIIWAPWRIEYIRSEKKVGCLLCRLFRKETKENDYILYRNENIFVLLNKYPYNPGHLMICPGRHCGRFSELTDAEWKDINHLLVKSEEILREVLKPQGFNIGVNIGKAAGAGVESHLHWHMVPRWSGDTNFMSVCVQTRVIPDLLENAYDQFSPFFREI